MHGATNLHFSLQAGLSATIFSVFFFFFSTQDVVFYFSPQKPRTIVDRLVFIFVFLFSSSSRHREPQITSIQSGTLQVPALEYALSENG